MVSIPNFNTNTSNFIPSSSFIVTQYLCQNGFGQSCKILSGTQLMILLWSNFIKIAFSAFPSLWLTFSWGFHTYMLTINSAGSVSKTSDTWWKYRYLPPTRKYRKYRYLVSVSWPSLYSTYKMLTTLFQTQRQLGASNMNASWQATILPVNTTVLETTTKEMTILVLTSWYCTTHA